ncbi:unnamed protein product, partial [Brugia timori]
PCPPPPSPPPCPPPPPPQPCPPPPLPPPCPPTYCTPPPPSQPPVTYSPPPKPYPYVPECPSLPPPSPSDCKTDSEVCTKCNQQSKPSKSPNRSMAGTYFRTNKRLSRKSERLNRRNKREETKIVMSDTCNSHDLMEIMDQNLSTNLAISKHLIQKYAELKLKRDFNVICSNNSFTFITHATLYCQTVKFNVSCYAFTAD